MAAEVGVLTLAAEKREKGQRGHEWHEEVSGEVAPFQGIPHCAQQADGGEERRGKADEVVGGTMGDDVEPVGGGCGDEDEAQAKAIAGEAEEVMDDDRTQQAVAHQVDVVGMQGQGGDQTVILALLKNGGGISGSLTKPWRFWVPRPAQAMDDAEAAADHHPHKAKHRHLIHDRGRWRPVAVFLEIGGNFRVGLLPGIFLNLNGNRSRLFDGHRMGDSPGGEHQGAGLEVAAVGTARHGRRRRVLAGNEIGHRGGGG